MQGSWAVALLQTRALAWGENGYQQVHLGLCVCPGVALLEGCLLELLTGLPRDAAWDMHPEEHGLFGPWVRKHVRWPVAAPLLLTSSCLAGEGDGTESATLAASKVSETAV